MSDRSVSGLFSAFELTPGDPLLAQPQSLAPPLIDPQPALLNADQMTWVEFERLIVAVARDVDGLRHVSRWGGPGQLQQGLDVVGKTLDEEWVGYQAKQVEDFNERDLKAAATRFAADRRPLGIKRFVLCTSVEANRRQIRETLAELQREHQDLDIELYDKAELSAKLRNRPDLVQRFFGEATASVFCTSIGRSLSISQPTAIDRATRADALMRGPVEAIDGLASAVSAAEQLEAADPVAAARMYSDVAKTLEEHNYRGNATLMRLRAADMLVGRSEYDPAIAMLADMIEAAVEAGEIDEVSEALHRIRGLANREALSAVSERRARAAIALHSTMLHPFDDLTDLATAFDVLAEQEHASFAVYALALVEAAIASDQASVILDRISVLGKAAEGAGSQTISLRIRLAIAESVFEKPWPARDPPHPAWRRCRARRYKPQVAPSPSALPSGRGWAAP